MNTHLEKRIYQKWDVVKAFAKCGDKCTNVIIVIKCLMKGIYMYER